MSNLRRRRTYGVVREAIGRSNRAGRVAITHYSVLGNHLHLIVEAADDQVLTRGMQGFSIRVAQARNALARPHPRKTAAPHASV